MRLDPQIPGLRRSLPAKLQPVGTQGAGSQEVALLEPWLSADDIAAHLGVTKDTVYTWIAGKSMPAHKLGHLWKFQAAEVDDWVRRNGATAAGD